MTDRVAGAQDVIITNRGPSTRSLAVITAEREANIAVAEAKYGRLVSRLTRLDVAIARWRAAGSRDTILAIDWAPIEQLIAHLGGPPPPPIEDETAGLTGLIREELAVKASVKRLKRGRRACVISADFPCHSTPTKRDPCPACAESIAATAEIRKLAGKLASIETKKRAMVGV